MSGDMGMMVEGAYHVVEPKPKVSADGTFRRQSSVIRNWITREGPFSPDPGRYHLYAAWNCPWAHRVLLARVALELKDVITVAYSRPRRTEQGWVFDAEGPFSDPDRGIEALHEVYALQRPSYTGRITMPVLWDRATEQIVSNESADLVRMLGAFPGVPDLYPEGLRTDIDAWNERIYKGLNNGVYRAGFAETQEAYEAGARDVFETLDTIEGHLPGRDWLVGDRLTEADLRLFPTLARFDVGYHSAFKCNLRRLVDYPNLWAYARRIYALPGVAETVRFDVYKRGYHSPSEKRNPLGIVPIGPELDWSL